jgi:hypothetical protein
MKTQHVVRSRDSSPEPTPWTCGKCKVRASRMPGFGTGRPEGWTEEKGEVICLLCRRAAAGDRGVESGKPTNGENTVRMRMASVIEFELARDADRSNSVIAKVCHTSVPTVLKVRNGLGLAAAPDPRRSADSKS